jgi:hypothetical protein
MAHARRKALPKIEWGLDVSAAAIYNSNIVGLSGNDRRSFLKFPAGFPTPLESVDDMENELQFHPTFRWRAPLNLMLGADYRLKLVHRLRNDFTDYQSHTVALSARPRVAGYRWSARLRIAGIPSYYLRVYKDRDYGRWEPAKYANWDYSASGRLRWWQSLWSEAGLGFSTYYYNNKFTEYDSENRYATLGSGYDFATGWSISGSFTRRIADNVGKDQPGVFNTPPADPSLIGDSEYGDSGFKENDWTGQVASHLDWVLPVRSEASLTYHWRRRVYTATRPLDLDPFHRGRVDRRGQFTAAVRVTIVPALTAEPYLTYDERRTDSPDLRVPAIKSFVRREFGLTVTYSLQ